jgi:catechol 2,3-dioxygenase-like lactoylglutathione lyase family enzyme
MSFDAGPELRFHHVGVACTDIRAEAARLALLGYTVEGDEFSDETQGVRGLFMAGQSPRLELLEPLTNAPAGVLTPWLKHDVKLYHLAYMVRDLANTIGHLRGQGAKLVVRAVPAAAFDGRQIAFLMLRNRMLIELIAPK